MPGFYHLSQERRSDQKDGSSEDAKLPIRRQAPNAAGFTMNGAKSALLWLLFLIGLLYLGAELVYSASRDRSEFTGLDNAMRLTHLVFTLPLLVLPIVQFSRRLRTKRPGVHRALGRIYLVSTMIAAVGAIYLGLDFDEAGRRIPLVLFACLWFYFSAAAWLAACRKDFKTHVSFVLRSYGVALAFVLVRILGQLDPVLLGFIADDLVRNVTREWLAFLIPLLVIEAGLSWIPSSRASRGGSMNAPRPAPAAYRDAPGIDSAPQERNI
jgi:uncharacterized membrane protein